MLVSVAPTCFPTRFERNDRLEIIEISNVFSCLFQHMDSIETYEGPFSGIGSFFTALVEKSDPSKGRLLRQNLPCCVQPAQELL